MKKISFLLLSVLFLSIQAQAQRSKAVYVDNEKDFLEAIAPNKIIRVRKNKLNLSDFLRNIKNTNVIVKKDSEGGVEIEIRDVDNLSIVGYKQRVKIVHNFREKTLITFVNCQNLRLENIEFAFGPQAALTSAPLLRFQNVKDLSLESVHFNGEMAKALDFEGVENARLRYIQISGCQKGIMDIRNCRQFSFSDSRFFNNRRYDLINIFDSEDIRFESCKIDLNQTGLGAVYDNYALFNVPLNPSLEKVVLRLKDCIIEDNYLQYFCRSPKAIDIVDSPLENNLITKGYNSQP